MLGIPETSSFYHLLVKAHSKDARKTTRNDRVGSRITRSKVLVKERARFYQFSLSSVHCECSKNLHGIFGELTEGVRVSQ